MQQQRQNFYPAQIKTEVYCKMNETVYTVYKTINIITDEYYIGVHKTNNPNDSYLGSGYKFQVNVEKYGKKNFKKFILRIFKTPWEALHEESLLVDVNDILCLNLTKGGAGGLPKNKRAYVIFTPSHRKNLSNSLKDRIYITNGTEVRRIKKDDMIPEGFIKGRTWTGGTKVQSSLQKQRLLETNKDSIFINNGEICKRIHKGSVIPNGWKKGGLKLKKKRKSSKGFRRSAFFPKAKSTKEKTSLTMNAIFSDPEKKEAIVKQRAETKSKNTLIRKFLNVKFRLCYSCFKPFNTYDKDEDSVFCTQQCKNSFYQTKISLDTALRGIFLKDESAKAEFLASVRK